MRAFVLMAALAFAAPAQTPAPLPETFFGHKMGADRHVLEWWKVIDYFYALDKASERMKVIEYGKSTEGRPMIAAIVSAPETLRRLDYFRKVQERLTDPRSTKPEEALKLAAEAKAVVLITCSVHATEIASTYTAVEFAYRLSTSNDAKVKQILDNTIVIIAPSINPDGLDLVTTWYRKTLNTPFEGTAPPELYQKYVGHDNNRDWYFFTQAENRAVITGLQNVWHPHIVYDVHQMGPTAGRMFVPPWMDPIEPNIDPVIAQNCNMVGMIMAADLTAAGRKGVVVNAMYDYWTPARHYQSYHGGLRILTESASVRIATPVTIKADQLSAQAQGYSPREKSWNHLEPWGGGEWKLRDIVDDQLIAMESLCTTAAVRRAEFVKQFYEINKRASERQAPYAFVIPASQADPGAARRLLETMDFAQVEVDKALEPFSVGQKRYEAGSYVIRMQQPFSSFAKALLEKQKYPDLRQYPGGPPKRPYDVTAHTLPLLLGVEVVTAEDHFQARLEKVKSFPLPARGLSASDSDSWRAINSAWKAKRPVWRNPKSGAFALGTRQPAGFNELKKPRIGIYKAFVPSMDEGWTRWIVELFGWEYSSVGNAEIMAGNLEQKYDVLIFADMPTRVIEGGFRQGAMPEDYVGGLGKEGGEALKAFANAGGKLLFFNDSTEYAVEHLGLKAKNALQGVGSRDFYCPGSLLKVKLDPGSPLSLGLPLDFSIWAEQSPVWEPEEASAKAVVRYSAAPVLDSGWLLGEKYLAGKPALLDVAVGQGHVVLFGMRPQYRAQSWLTLKLVFNALVM